METLRTIRLYGKLGAQFGRVHRLAVANTAEAVRALCAMIPGFQRELMTSKDRGIVYACFLGKKNIGKDELTLSGGTEDIRIAPAMSGAKSGGVIQFITGATLFVAGAILATYGFVTGNPLLFEIGVALKTLGTYMMVAGVVQMLSPQPQRQSAKDKPDNQASYNFNGPVNTQAQGNPVPLLYGRLIVGSAVISAGILAQDQAYVGAPKARPPIRNVQDDYGDLV